MKRREIFIAIAILLAITINSCIDPVTFDTALLIGKWSRPSPFATTENPGDEYYRYDEDGGGATWDTADDVTEAEAQLYTWSVTGSKLTQVHVIEMGGTVTKIYTLTSLTATTLVYKDDFGKTFTFSKVP
jgi:hypothetical protein